MRLVIDMQGAQSASRLRGIGRYTMSLVDKLITLAEGDELLLAFNGELDENLGDMLEFYSSRISSECIHVWGFCAPTRAIDPASTNRRSAAEQVFEGFIASLNPDVVLITSLFEGFVDDAAPSIGSLTGDALTGVILYDLIPLLHPVPYLEDSAYREFYLAKLKKLRRADFLLAISESSRCEAIDHLSFEPDRVVNIATASTDFFRPVEISQQAADEFLWPKGLVRPYIMYAGATDARKNHARLILAYAQLPTQVRGSHQLAIVGGLPDKDRAEFERLATEAGLAEGEMIVVGHVSDNELLKLYNLSKAFIFPSWHEGFGLPALEAMQCGRAVVASNVSSLPEVLGKPEALFDPFDVQGISAAIERVLTDEEYRHELERHALEQAATFSWERSAHTAWSEIRRLAALRAVTPVNQSRRRREKLRLAYVSPLPPEQSGISDYSADILPALSAHYDIDVIVKQEYVSDSWVVSNIPIRNIDWFRANFAAFDRILYHVGNSPFHDHMFDLGKVFPGVVVMHDFFLSGVIAHLELTGQQPGLWTDALWYSHGWHAIRERALAGDIADTIRKYPCNLEILQSARGIITHSTYSSKLASQWYGSNFAELPWSTIPLARSRPKSQDKGAARQELGIRDGDFLVCSFGFLDFTKLNHILLAAWEQSALAADANCHLVFVGQNHGGEYGAFISDRVSRIETRGTVRITGWIGLDVYAKWLSAADLCVQLRTHSRGETSAAVMDCLNYGIPTIVNANGSMADISDEIVVKLPDEFEASALCSSIEALWRAPSIREALGQRAAQFMSSWHSPAHCANLYFEAIERTYEQTSVSDVVRHLGQKFEDVPGLEAKLAFTFRRPFESRRILLDVTELSSNDLRTGIQRVVKSILRELSLLPMLPFRVDPVRAMNGKYVFAKGFMLNFLGVDPMSSVDEEVVPTFGDIFIAAEWTPHVVEAQEQTLRTWRRRGVGIYFVVHDLLPVLRPNFFPPGIAETHHEWLRRVASFDGAICVSKAVCDDYKDWLDTFGPVRPTSFKLGWSHNGADLPQALDAKVDLPSSLQEALDSTTTFLIVGTLEPRKGHRQALAAFNMLWSDKGAAVSLVVVGKKGWMVDDLAEDLAQHVERNRRLFWLEAIDDAALSELYRRCDCLLAPSEGEGFGLPLIEAALNQTPVIARDLPVFREVGGEGAFYFENSNDPHVIAEAIQNWIQLVANDSHPKPWKIERLTWAASARNLIDIIVQDRWALKWLHSGTARFWGGDPRLLTEVGLRMGRVIKTTGCAGHLIFGPYCRWEAGSFQLRLWFDAAHLTGVEWIDLTCNQGTRKLAHQTLTRVDGGMLVSFELEMPVPDLEIRVWVSSESVLSVSGFEIVKRESHLQRLDAVEPALVH